MGLLNKAFFHLGYGMASHPFAVCLGCMFVTLVCSLGFTTFVLTVSARGTSHV